MIVRALDQFGDWTYGKGKNDYKKDRDAVAQNIATRLRSFLGDCFFSTTSGVDWFNLLGGKSVLDIDIAVSTTILNTLFVTGLLELSSNLLDDRTLIISYSVQTTFGVISNSFQYDFNGLV